MCNDFIGLAVEIISISVIGISTKSHIDATLHCTVISVGFTNTSYNQNIVH